MPFISISTPEKILNKESLLEKSTHLIAELTNKSEKFVMVKLNENVHMSFGGKTACCFVEVKSIGSLNPPIMSQKICELLSSCLGISTDMIYIQFEDINASNWGWKSQVFG